MPSRVKSCGISEDLETLSQIYIAKGENYPEITEEATEILENLKDMLLQNYQRQNVEGSQGIWFCVKKKNAAFFVLTDFNYSDRLAYNLLGELEEQYDVFLSEHDLNALKKEGNELIDKYNNPANFDKLSQAREQVEDIKVEVQENVNKLMTNGDNLNDLEDQTHNIRMGAEKFGKNSKSLERQMYWRKIRNLAIIIGIIILVIIIIVIITQI